MKSKIKDIRKAIKYLKLRKGLDYFDTGVLKGLIWCEAHLTDRKVVDADVSKYRSKWNEETESFLMGLTAGIIGTTIALGFILAT